MNRNAHTDPNRRRISAYRLMWLVVFFDLPVGTKQQRHDATRFRKRLLKDGFQMHQFSVYFRHCASVESADVHAARVGLMLPPYGHVSVAQFTDKQFGRIKHFFGKGQKPAPPPPQQLEMF